MSSFLNQPKGMFLLGCTEIFERLSFYTLATLLVLYASAPVAQGGLGWTKEAAILLMGKFTFAVFTVPILGGIIADRYIGPYRATILGGLLIITGHITIYFANYSLVYFYMALCFIVSGIALFIPSTPTLLGLLYSQTDSRREGGFNFYYMGINIGGLIAGFGAGLLLRYFGFQIALSAAGIGMIFGLCLLIFGKRYLVTNFLKDLTPKTKSKIETISPKHKKAIIYLFVSFIFYAIWAIVYNLVISGTLTIYIEYFTQKNLFGYDIPTSFFSSLESIGIVLFAPIVNFILAFYAQRKKPIHFFTQMVIGLIFTFIAVAYFTHLTFVVENAGENTKPFNYLSICLFILIVSLSELLISPVAMSAISVLSPPQFATTFQALNLSIIGFMGLVAGQIGARSLVDPFHTFFALSVLTFVGAVIFIFISKFMIRAANEASMEAEKELLIK